MTHIVLASNSNQQVQAFGPFEDEGKAERWAAKKRREYGHLDWIVLPITPKVLASRWSRVQ